MLLRWSSTPMPACLAMESIHSKAEEWLLLGHRKSMDHFRAA
jgi:hypothetical protein